MTLNEILQSLEVLKSEHGGDVVVVVSDSHIPAAGVSHSTTSLSLPGSPTDEVGVIVIALAPSRRM
jgi:hypothetical protein